MSQPFTGKGVDRVDARLKVTGSAPYAAEVPVANVAHALIVTSPVGLGQLRELDTRAAEQVEGVLAVLSHRNAPKLPGADKKTGPIDRKLQLLQDDEIRYNDQPIALVVADSLESARYAASLLVFQIEPGKPALDLLALEGEAYKPESAGPGSPSDSKRGDVTKALASAPIKVEQTYTTPVEHHNPLEMHATTCMWQGPESLTVYDSTQGIFGVRKKLATTFEIPLENVRVISSFVGGGFGCKGSPWSHVVLAALASRVVSRPVKLMLTRQQMFSFVGNRPRTVQRLALAAERSGKLTAMRHEVLSESSRFDEFVEGAGVTASMLYACPNVETKHRIVRLDIPTPTFMRAPGKSSGTYALESAMDELSYALGIDPLTLRLRNFAERDSGKDKPWSSNGLRECYRQGAERFGWSKRPMAVRARNEDGWWIGWGMATATYPAEQSKAKASARLRKDGSVLVQAGSQDIGTGTYTIMTQIAADALSLPLECVRFELGDTNMPENPVSGGSQTASSTGSAVRGAALALKRKIIEAAVGDAKSALFGKPTELVVAEDGQLGLKGEGKLDSYRDVLARSGRDELDVSYDSEAKKERESYSLHSFGAQFVEVKVDEATGEVRVSRCVGAFAAGKILNAKTAKSQFQGGIIWGISMALHEHTVRDARTGRAVTRDLADYHVPVHADVPDIDVIMVPEEDPYVNDLGAKGIGEIGITGIGAAIANAVYHATGRRVRDLPITLDKLL